MCASPISSEHDILDPLCPPESVKRASSGFVNNGCLDLVLSQPQVILEQNKAEYFEIAKRRRRAQ